MGSPTSRAMAAAWAVVAACVPPWAGGGETVRLRATADIWVSSFQGEEGFSAGRHPFFKLKTIQELALIRFDAAPALGREALRARLFLRRAGRDKLRYIRVSTVNADWEEGTRRDRLGPGDGATYNHPDGPTRRAWAWPGSQLCDVIMGSGNTLATWAERRELADGWISVDLTPELIYALAIGDSDGLAVMDGGTPSFENNLIHSVQSKGSEPYIEVELGKPLDAAPGRPSVQARPAPGRAHMASGTVEVEIAPDAGRNAFCWRVRLNGKALPRWRIKHPAPDPDRLKAGLQTKSEKLAVLCLDDLEPDARCELEVVAVSAGGKVSEPAKAVVTASPALAKPPVLTELDPEAEDIGPMTLGGKARIWVCPGLVKVSPETGDAMSDDVGTKGDYRQSNPVWDGRRIRLFGARGETVSFQVVTVNLTDAPLREIKLTVDPRIGSTELFKNWPARNKGGRWQPAYCVPLAPGAAFEIPDPLRKLPNQRSQSITVDVHIPQDAKAGTHAGAVEVRAGGGVGNIPVSLEVLDFALPDKLCFWPQLNAYDAPKAILDYYRLAHEHRCVLFYRYWRPALQGSGKDIQVVWEDYDRNVGPLLSGEAFKGCRRAGVPIEAVALPFFDSWPTPLTPQTYRYSGHWPQRGDPVQRLIDHYLTAPYIGGALSQEYTDAFAAVQRQFIEHFRQRGWTATEMQCLFVGKNTHRIQYGVNMWWTTDEPYHWDDWLALQYFCRLWTRGRPPVEARPTIPSRGIETRGREEQWVVRADISRPEWQDGVLDGAVDTVYFGTGAFSSPAMIRRCQALVREAPFDLRVYGSANADNASNFGTVAWVLHAFLNGASAALPWQALGNEKALDIGDRAVGGNALLAPGDRFGVPVVADLRLKAFRDAEQVCEYLKLVADRYHLNAEQLRAMVLAAVDIQARTAPGAGADNADALAFSRLNAWQLAGLRRALAALIVEPR